MWHILMLHEKYQFAHVTFEGSLKKDYTVRVTMSHYSDAGMWIWWSPTEGYVYSISSRVHIARPQFQVWRFIP